MKQYLPKMPLKRGFKVWVRAESQTGYFCDFEVYAGRSTDTEEEVEHAGIPYTDTIYFIHCIPYRYTVYKM